MAAPMEETLSSELSTFICKTLGIAKLRDFQTDVLNALVFGKKDALVCVPTGSGKTVCFSGLIPMFDSVSNAKKIVLVVSPLKMLMSNQVKTFNSLGLASVMLGDSGTMKRIREGSVRYIFGNPEAFLEKEEAKSLLQNTEFEERVGCIVFDEVHTAVSWGLSKESRQAFRGYFSKVGDLRSFFPAVPLLALTATASFETQHKIRSLLCLRDPFIVNLSPDRPNIRLHVAKVKDSLDCMEWLVEKLEQEGSDCLDKTLVYCRTYKDCSKLYGYFLDALGQSVDLEKRVFDMVHSSTPQHIKEHVENALCDPKSNMRVVFATKLLGLGLDVQCNTIVHYGPPNSMDDYLQQIGRAGRNGEQAHAVMLYNSHQLRNVEPSVLNFVKNPDKECLRKESLKDFAKNHNDKEVAANHRCCSVCSQKCNCSECPSYLSLCEIYKQDEKQADESQRRNVDESVALDIRVRLYEIKGKLDKKVIHDGLSYTKPDLIHGLSVHVIDKIISKLEVIFSVDDLITQCDFFIYETATEIIKIISEVIPDVDSNTDIAEDLIIE